MTYDKRQEKVWAAEIKYYAARAIYNKRELRTKIKKVTWQEWWESRFGESYTLYIDKMKARPGSGLSLHEFFAEVGEL